jgi:alkylation response protein AidB-like acyl-CoA dehydrogenase
MNFELSDEQALLREAARDALSRTPTLAAAREALDGAALPDLWPAARDAGWPGLLISDAHGGAGLGAFDAMLVMLECGRVLASVPLLGHLPATALLDVAAAGRDDAQLADALAGAAAGDRRAAYLGARPPEQPDAEWTTEPAAGVRRAPLPEAALDGPEATVTGHVAWVPDARGADLLVVPARTPDGAIAVVLIEGGADGLEVEPVTAYDATRPLGDVTLEHCRGRVLALSEAELATAWFLVQGLLAAEAIGAVEAALERSVEYAKQRFTFGRAIGSYQAVKHALVEILRLLENARSLMYYAGWAHAAAPGEFPLAASAARVAAGQAQDFAARQLISVHGGIGATWEHDAPLYFRRAQLARRLLGGAGGAADRVGLELIREHGAAA